jgi:hypothetical protein
MRNSYCVMPGLDPRIHDAGKHETTLRRIRLWHRRMDCRVKPGNDSGEVVPVTVKP